MKVLHMLFDNTPAGPMHFNFIWQADLKYLRIKISDKNFALAQRFNVAMTSFSSEKEKKNFSLENNVMACKCKTLIANFYS